MVGAGADCGEDFVRLRGGKDKPDVFWRLFDNFEQRIKTLLGDHVGLVQDEDFVAIAGGSKDGALPQFSRIIHTVMARGVDFDNVQRPPTLIGKLHTTGAAPTGGVGRTFVTVPTFGKDPRRGGFPTPPRPRKQIGVV